MPEEDVAVTTTTELAKAPSESPAARIAFIGGFLLLISVIPAIQTVWELSHGERLQVLEVFSASPTAEGLAQFERAVEEHSLVGREVRERWHWLRLVALRAGNQKTVLGVGDSVFYRPSLDSAVAPRYRAQDGPAANRDMPAFLDAMQQAGVTVVYPADAMWRARNGAPLYLKQDTHWTPEGMALAADELLQALDEDLSGATGLTARPMQVACNGDLYDMLGLPDYLRAPLPRQSVAVQQVVDASGRPIDADMQSPVVLLGDSFTNIYSLADMGWGDHAGLGEQLALRLDRPVDVIALNDGGVNTARGNLARRPDALSGKRVVIWQFAARDLVLKNREWQIIEIDGRQGGPIQ